MGREPARARQFPGLLVVGLVQAEAFGPLACGLGPLHGEGIEGPLQELVVVAVGACVRQAYRHPGPFGEDRAFRPFLGLSLGSRPVLDPRGALVMARSQDRKSQSMPATSSCSNSLSRQKLEKTPARCHCWERLWAEELVQMPVAVKGFHCVPLSSTKRMASIALLSRTRVRWQSSSGCRGRGGRRGAVPSHDQSGIRQPS